MTDMQSASHVADPSSANGVFEEAFKPLTAQEARDLRLSSPHMSVERCIGMQLVVGGVMVLLAWWWGGRQVALSVGWGAAAVIVPAVVFARALQRQARLISISAVLRSFVVWELVKVSLTVLLLLAAPKTIPGLDWLALVAGFVVVLKVYWAAAFLQSRHLKSA